MPTEKLTTIYSQHTLYLQRLGATEGLKVVPYLELVESSVLSILNKYRKRKVTPALQVDIQRQISLATRKHLQDYTSQLKIENRALGAYEGEFAAATLNGIITADDFKAVAPVASAVNAIATITPVKIGTNSYSSYTSLMSNYWQKWENEIDGVVLDGFRSGSTIPEITNAITEQMDLSRSGTTKSVLDRARKSARQLAITGTNHYANTARIAFVDTNSAILSGYRFLAVQDSRTSKQCASLDQRVFAKDDPKLSSATPPLHPNCRSALTYEVADKFKLDAADTRKASSFEVGGRRDPKTVTSDSIYYDNLKGLNKTDQDAVLGPTMGRAFRKMDNPAQFAKATVDENFNPLTIKQMREKNNVLGKILQNQKAEPLIKP